MKLIRMLMAAEKMRSSTLDAKELHRFSSLAQDSWWTGKQAAPLRSLNELRIPLIRDAVTPVTQRQRTAKPLTGVRLVDVGSGGGLVSEPLARLGAQVTGLDPVAANVEFATKRMSESLRNNLTYLVSSVEDFAQRPENESVFHGVVASEVMEHVDDVSLFLDSVHKLLVPGSGKLIITTINQTLAAQVSAIWMAEDILNLVPRGTHEYRKLVADRGLDLMLQEKGFTVQSLYGMMYNPLSNTWSWTTCTAVNYAIVAVRKDVQ